MELEFQNGTISPYNVTIGSLKRNYRAPGIIFFFFYKLDFETIEFQNMSISLISLRN